MPISAPSILAQRQRFLSLYSRRDRHIYKRGASWRISRFPLTSQLINAAISAKSEKVFGTFWSQETEFAVIDIDAQSQYHSAFETSALLKRLAAVGLGKALLFQSSASSGWHIYFPFTSKVCSIEIETYLKRFLRLSNFSTKCGQLEIFPSGNALRLPLQRGFAWLDQNFEVIAEREQLSTDEAVTRFVADFENNKNDWEQAKLALEHHFQKHEMATASEGFDHLFGSRLIHQNYEKGRELWQTGLVEKNQRHEAILCIEHYLWHGDPEIGLPARPGHFNDKARFELILGWIKEKHNGLSGHVNCGNWRTIELDIERAVKWRAAGAGKRTVEPYPCTERALEVLEARARRTGRAWTMEDLKKGNDRREAQARKKISSAVAAMRLTGQQLTRNAIARESGCSPNTVSKHSDIWKTLTSGSSDQSRGVGGSSESMVPITDLRDSGAIVFQVRETFPKLLFLPLPPFPRLFSSLADTGGSS